MKQHSFALTSRRRAFTLVELLVVIGIIAILAALASWGVVAMIGTQYRRNTESAITVVDKVLQDHWRHVVEEAKKDRPSQAVKNMAAPDADGQRAQVLWIKFRLMEAFPQTFVDITAPFVYTNDPSGLPYIPPAQRRYIVDYQAKTANRVVANTKAPNESAACLLLALGVSRAGVSLSQDQIKFAVKDTDSDGVPELVDGWGRPLAFFRFPWNNADLQNARPAAANPALKAYPDPADSMGMLITSAWVFLPRINAATPNTRENFEDKFHSVTWLPGSKLPVAPVVANLQGTYVIPVIVSAGKDGQFGLNVDASGYFLRDMSIANAGQNTDNIYSYKLRGN